MDTQVSVISRLVASVVAMTIFLMFDHRVFVRSSLISSSVSSIISDTKDVMDGTERVGRIRYHYFNENFEGMNMKDPIGTSDSTTILANTASGQCSDILMIGVGTAMSVEDYDKLAESVVAKERTNSFVVVIADPNPGHFVKFPSTKYASLANSIRDQLHSGLIPMCTRRTKRERSVWGKQQQRNVNFLIGGHSTGGQAALDAAQKGFFGFEPNGFVGLDPYDISEKTMDFGSPLQFPTLSWGFTHTTCFVQVEQAAQGAYRLSSSDSGRVLYLIDNEHNGMTHCVFTDDGCGVGAFDVCPTKGEFEWVYESVAESIHLFLNVLKTDGSHFTKENFEIPSTASGDVHLFVNSDDPGTQNVLDNPVDLFTN